jgi:RNA polymerase sigma-70 factor (ECF subfamily)
MGPVTADEALPPDGELIRRLRDREEAAFRIMVDAWSPGMIRLARSLLTTTDSAIEVVQDTWVAVLTGIESFQGRSALRTWVYRILVNTAKRRRARESRIVPWSSWEPEASDRLEPTVDPTRFQGTTEPYPGHWRESPLTWATPETATLAREVRATMTAVLLELPMRQRIVLTLRDVEGYTSEEVCEILGVSTANQRVLLHRARAAVRAALEAYFALSGEREDGRREVAS